MNHDSLLTIPHFLAVNSSFKLSKQAEMHFDEHTELHGIIVNETTVHNSSCDIACE